MRTFVLLGLFCLGCPSSSGGPDAGHVTPKAAAIDSAEEEVDETPDAGTPARPAAIRSFDASHPQRTKNGAALLLCDTHSTWAPPKDFTAAAVGTTIVARKGNELVGVAYPLHAEASFAGAVAPLVDGTLAWDTPSTKKIDDWHAEATTHGRGNDLVVAARTLYSGVDPKTGAGRAGRDLQHADRDVVWVAIAPTEKRADELLADARAAEHALTDHACACGYDCAHKP